VAIDDALPHEATVPPIVLDFNHKAQNAPVSQISAHLVAELLIIQQNFTARFSDLGVLFSILNLPALVRTQTHHRCF